MKKDSHPACREVAFSCSCGNVVKVLSVIDKESIHIDVCSKCHPFYTGKQKLLDTGGRLHRFRQKYGRKSLTAPEADHAAKSASAQ